MAVGIPFFHYTTLSSLKDILTEGRILSRDCLTNRGTEFEDISIDHNQTVRQSIGLTKYIPMFAGFYSLYRAYEFNGYLMNNYDNPKIQNVSFYGSLNKVLQQTLGENYQNVIIFMIRDEHIYLKADEGKIRFFSDIAIKEETVELEPIGSKAELQAYLDMFISGQNTKVELDLLDDGNSSITCMNNIEALIVDSEKIEQQVRDIMGNCNKQCQVFVNPLPRNPIN
jgi:hypothetical protein